MKNNKDDPKTKAQRVYDYYRAIEVSKLKRLTEVDYYDINLLKNLATIQHRRAFAGRILGIGII